MKLVKEYINEKFTEDSDPIRDMGIGNKKIIIDWLKKYNIEKCCIINNDLTIDTIGSINLQSKKLRNFPKYIQFNVVKNGYFDIRNNNFTTLKGCPIQVVNGFFSCSNNKLTSLKYSPIYVRGDFCCDNNLLKSLKGCPKKMGNCTFFCSDNLVKFSIEDVKKLCAGMGTINN